MIFFFLLLLTIIGFVILDQARQWKEAAVRLDEIISQLSQGQHPRSFVRTGPKPLVQLSNQIEKVAELQIKLLRQLQEEGYSHQVILKGMIEGVLVVDHEKKIRLANQAFLDLFQIQKDPIGKSVMETTRFPELDRLIQKTLSHQSVQSSEFNLTPVSPSEADSPLHAQVNTFPFPIQSTGKIGVVLVFHNITRTKQLEEVRKEFVGNVSHELKTPLAIFQGYVETLLDNPQLDAEERNRIFQTLLRHSHRLNALVEDLLSLARLESRRVPIQFERIPIHLHLETLMEDWKKQVEAKRITLNYTPPSSPIEVEVDLLRFEQVVNNLMDNAIKYSKEGGSIRVLIQRTEDHFELRIQDEGVGIPAADLPHIFERFYRVDKARSREMGGTGLGLSIVKHIVLLHQGEARAESEEGKGTTIIVRLPLRQSESS
jgi:two-component system phosphate regulon sensor histidine kinase PhoR